MAQKPPRNPAPPAPAASFNTAQLIRLLAAWVEEPPTPARSSIAERLGQWLGWADAIALSAALNEPPAPAAEPVLAHAAAQIARNTLARTRAELTRAIQTDPALSPTPDRQPLASARWPAPPPPPATPLLADEDEGFAPLRRSLQAHQRAMAARIAPLREQARDAVRAMPHLSRLAATDAVLDQALAERERLALAAIPGWAEKRFERLRRATPATAGSGALPTTDENAPLAAPPVWRAAFVKDLQALLLAELALRLQPVEGLVKALGPESPTS